MGLGAHLGLGEAAWAALACWIWAARAGWAAWSGWPTRGCGWPARLTDRVAVAASGAGRQRRLGEEASVAGAERRSRTAGPIIRIGEGEATVAGELAAWGLLPLLGAPAICE